jgi:hypothetical protein
MYHVSNGLGGMNAWKLTGGFPAGIAITPGAKGRDDPFGGFLADDGLSGLGGGTIMAARGSFDAAVAAGAAGTGAGLLATIGGGAIGLAFSAGSSPGNTHTFLSAS